LRNAADMMLDEDWESAMGELEVGDSWTWRIIHKWAGCLWGATC
jgi:hypothetical protein